VVAFNARVAELFGFPPDVLHVGAEARDLIEFSVKLGHFPGQSASEVFDLLMARLETRAWCKRLDRFANGRTLEANYSPIGTGEWLLTYEDVSARTDAEAALAQQNERLDAAMSNIPHGVCMFDRDKRLIVCNAGYQQLYGLPESLTVAGTRLRQILEFRGSVGNAPREMATYFDVAADAKAAHSARSRRIELQDGRFIRITHNPMASGGYVATHEDITEAVRAREQIRFLGSHDGLTGLPNRMLLGERITEALARTRQNGMFCIHYLDLDHFKSVNDTHGHSIGDLLLTQAADRFNQCLRETDTLARLGGDEFVVLQGNVENTDDADKLARHLVAAISEPFDLDGRQVYLGVSVGIALCPNDGRSVDVLLKNADMAMYRAKSEGRSTYRFFEPEMDARLQERRALEVDLRCAISNGEFELHYQPQVNAQTDEITGCEALLRWKSPSRGIVAPAQFIPLAEETGLIVPLGAWVIRQACHDAAGWPKQVGVAINLSSAQFKGLALVQTVIAALDESGLSPMRLEFEITESVLLADNENTIATLKQLRGLGIRIAMDDFGTGYSSLSYLRSFPFDKIKIDRSFIKDLGEREDCLAIVRAVASLGAALGMVTTAEGVETVEQLRHIREQGCTEVQGYFYGRPCPVSKLNDFFRNGDARGRMSN
jgi:diguanylate cyclase (GGDEF)-like protein